MAEDDGKGFKLAFFRMRSVVFHLLVVDWDDQAECVNQSCGISGQDSDFLLA